MSDKMNTRATDKPRLVLWIAKLVALLLLIEISSRFAPILLVPLAFATGSGFFIEYGEALLCGLMCGLFAVLLFHRRQLVISSVVPMMYFLCQWITGHPTIKRSVSNSQEGTFVPMCYPDLVLTMVIAGGVGLVVALAVNRLHRIRSHI